MTCRQLIEFISDYIEGGLPPEQKRLFDAHVKDCGSCREYLKQLGTTIDLTKLCCGEADQTPLPPDMVRAILAAAKK